MAKQIVNVKKAAPASAPAPTASPDPWSAFRNEMEQFYDRFSRGFGMPSFWRGFGTRPGGTSEPIFSFSVPAADVTEDQKAYKISAELPGLDEKDVAVSVSGDMLVLKGEKRKEKQEKGKNYYLTERSYGSFQRSFYLPDGVDRDRIAADFSKGVLTITLPKTAEAKKQQKRIDIKSA